MSRPRVPPGLATAVAVATAALALGAWSRAGAHLPPVGGLEDVSGERLLWIGPGIGPVGAGGDLERADLLVVGDSRVGHGVHLSIAAELGLGRVATIWGSGTELLGNLQALDRLAPRRLVVALSPFGLVGHRDGAVPELSRERHPAFDPARPPRDVRAWAADIRAELTTAERPAETFEGALAWWVSSHRLARAALLRQRLGFDPQGLDLSLAHRADRARALRLGVLQPSQWEWGWAPPHDPRASDAAYRSALAPLGAAQRSAARAALEERFRELTSAGWELACVRLPIDPGLRALEDEAGIGAELSALVERLGVPYLDLGAWPDATTDGSHLHWRGADRATRALGRWLREDLGWGR